MNGWKTNFDSDSDDFSESDLPPAGYNADAALARELDVSSVWEPAGLKVTQTPFMLAERRKKDAEEKRAQKAARNAAAAAAAAAQAEERRRKKESEASRKDKGRMIATQRERGGDDMDAEGEDSNGSDDLSDTQSSSSPSPSPPPPPPPRPARRRGPVPAKSGRLFTTEVPEDDKPKGANPKQPYRRWTKAELDGRRDAKGNPIPSSSKNGKANQPTLKDMLDQPAAKGKGRGKGKGKAQGKGRTVHVPAPGTSTAIPDLPVEQVKEGKRKVPAKRKAAPESRNAEAGPSSKTGRDEGEGDGKEVKKPKIAVKLDGTGKGKGKGKGKPNGSDIVFTRLPAGAAANANFPIIEAIERQKSLPTKRAAPPKTKGKGRGKAAAAAKTSPSPSPSAADAKVEAMLDDLIGQPRTAQAITMDKIFPASTTAVNDRGATDGDAAYDSLESLGGSEDEAEVEGKKAVMSRFFGTVQKSNADIPAEEISGLRTLVNTPPMSPLDDTINDPPTMTKLRPDDDSIHPAQTVDSSSNLPYSSPTESRQLRRQDSKLVHPRPVRAKVDPLPNADKYEQQLKANFARLQDAADEAGKNAAEREKNKDAPDVMSFTKKGYTHVAAPMSATRARRPRSPQSQIDNRFRSHGSQPLQKPSINSDNFRSQAYLRTHGPSVQIPNEDDGWSTIERKGIKRHSQSYEPEFINGLVKGSVPASYLSDIAREGGGGAKGGAITTSHMPRKSSLFTPQAPCEPPPTITVKTPRFRVSSSAQAGGTKQYGATASSRDTQDVYDPYKRKIADDLPTIQPRPRFGDTRSAKRNGSSRATPEVEMLVGRHGQYMLQKTSRFAGGEVPRYMPAAVTSSDVDTALSQSQPGYAHSYHQVNDGGDRSFSHAWRQHRCAGGGQHGQYGSDSMSTEPVRKPQPPSQRQAVSQQIDFGGGISQFTNHSLDQGAHYNRSQGDQRLRQDFEPQYGLGVHTRPQADSTPQRSGRLKPVSLNILRDRGLGNSGPE